MVSLIDFPITSLWDIILWGALLVFTLIAIFTTYQVLIFGKVTINKILFIWAIPIILLLFIIGRSMFDYFKNNQDIALVILFLIIIGFIALTPKSKKRKK